MAQLTTRERYLQRLSSLTTERSSWIAHWRELCDYLAPRRGRFLGAAPNQGAKRNSLIINSSPLRAVRILGSGMMSGCTSQARPWFTLTTPDPELAEVDAVRGWLHVVEERMRGVFSRSNIYKALALMYPSLGVYGTSAIFLEEDPHTVIRAYSLPIGSYSLANSSRQTVDTIYRELWMTVAQLVEKFSLEHCSPNVQNLYRLKNLDEWMQVNHVIEPNTDREEGRADYRGMPWRSCWMEGSNTTEKSYEGFLNEGGFEEFPVLAPRWEVTGEDVYGSGPGMEALGDTKALQLLEKRKATIGDLLTKPPMAGPSSLRNQRASLLPGDVTYVDSTQGTQRFEPAYAVPPTAMQVVEASIAQHERRIDAIFFADLWLMLSESDDPTKTAREVAERHEEKMLQLGPVLESLNEGAFDPLIERTFGAMLRRGMVPPPPEELQGVEIRVEYTSILAQAQKLLGTTAVERLAGFTGNLAAAKPEVLDKLNTDEMIDEYAAMLGVKPDLIRSDEEVAAIRAQRAQQQQAAQQGQAMLAAAQGAATLSKADLEGDNALSRLTNTLGPQAAAATGVR